MSQSQGSLSYYRDTCSSMDVAALLTKVRKWDTPKMFAKWWIGNETVADSWNAVLSACKNSETMKFQVSGKY